MILHPQALVDPRAIVGARTRGTEHGALPEHQALARFLI